MLEAEICQEIRGELALMASTSLELEGVLQSLKDREPSRVELAAIGAFLVDLYGGAERVLKRLAVSAGGTVPTGGAWHRELLDLFRPGTTAGLPGFLDEGALAVHG